jgi:hypothetical protein
MNSWRWSQRRISVARYGIHSAASIKTTDNNGGTNPPASAALQARPVTAATATACRPPQGAQRLRVELHPAIVNKTKGPTPHRQSWTRLTAAGTISNKCDAPRRLAPRPTNQAAVTTASKSNRVTQGCTQRRWRPSSVPTSASRAMNSASAARTPEEHRIALRGQQNGPSSMSMPSRTRTEACICTADELKYRQQPLSDDPTETPSERWAHRTFFTLNQLGDELGTCDHVPYATSKS